jgi:hypothetical protein
MISCLQISDKDQKEKKRTTNKTAGTVTDGRAAAHFAADTEVDDTSYVIACVIDFGNYRKIISQSFMSKCQWGLTSRLQRDIA